MRIVKLKKFIVNMVAMKYIIHTNYLFLGGPSALLEIHWMLEIKLNINELTERKAYTSGTVFGVSLPLGLLFCSLCRRHGNNKR